MIVWRTILGLIVASKWPAPESQSVCRFSNDRRQGLVINANKFREARSYAKNPRLDFINWTMSMAAACDSAAEQAYSSERAGGLECNDWNNDNREALRGPRNKGIDELQLLERNGIKIVHIQR